ncbi:TPA: cyclase family protein [Candidatus Bipolaricaulota bacterium]|nr:cyclase family protein [Candidatus Bipolaricaulota bacterium]
MARIIDLSVPTEDSPSEPLPVKVNHEPHQQSVEMMKMFFGCTEQDLPQGLGWANDSVTLGTHAGTHVDAPWHYSPTAEGKRARTIDEMPLDWFFHDGVVLDMRHKPKGSAITVDDLKAALAKINYQIKPWDIVMIQTGADKLWGKPEYFEAGCGMTRESTLWLIEQGVRVMGTDAWGWDRPFWAIKEEFARTGNKSIIWGAHFAGRDKEYCHIEKLANLDKLPRPFGFKVACFPVKLTGGSAGWSRVVAIVED